MVRNFFQFKVGDGNGIFTFGLIAWWHPDGILYEKYGQRIIYDAGSRIDAKFSSVLKNKNWCWPSVKSDELVYIQSKIPLVINIGEAYQPI